MSHTRLYTENDSVTTSGEAVILYRLPGEKEKHCIKGMARTYPDNSILSSNRPGFVLAPFADTSVIWIEGEECTGFPETLPPAGKELPEGQVFSEESRLSYHESVRKILALIRKGEASKVVYSRQFAYPLDKDPDPLALFMLLCELYPRAFVYLASVPVLGLWLGATPETLFSLDRDELRAMALAGSRPSGETGSWPDKEMREHNYVGDHIRERLNEAGCMNIRQGKTEDITAGKVVHLRTAFEASLGSATVATLATALHPTPAVCGLPASAALEIIRESEPYSRGFYTGYLGPLKEGKVDLFVNLRCVQLLSGKAILYVGGGLVEGSDPEAEWRETELKSTTILAAIEKLQNFTI